MFVENSPRIALVIAKEFCFCTPRIIMHICRASQTTATVARWRATGFDGALVGEALMRASDPGGALAALLAPHG